MKNIIIVMLLLAGCSQGGHISGLYVKHVESEFSVGEDSVFISHADGHYIMDRHTGYRRIKNGAMAPKEMKQQHAVLAPAGDRQWQDTKTGTIITFKDNGLLLGTASYQKIQ